MDRTKAFLAALTEPEQAEPKAKREPREPRAAPRAKVTKTRDGLKHIGGYFGPEDVERIAILRARLGMDNSQLISLAIEELWKKHAAQRVFGDR